jgi:hypothetical protein
MLSSLAAVLKRSLEQQLATERAVQALQTQVRELQEQNTLLQRDLTVLNEHEGKLDREAAREHERVTCVERELLACRENVTTLQNDWNRGKDGGPGPMSGRQVAFHAILTNKTKLSKRDILVCDEILSNLGDAYSGLTGVFTAPASGLYCFLATSSAGVDDKELSPCKLDLMVGERDVAFLSARGRDSCSTHAVLKVAAGQRAYLRANEDSKFAGGWRTSFTGVLVQPDV